MKSDQSSYFVPAEQPEAELARLVAQDRLVTSLAGLFPPSMTDQIASLHRVFDIGCGPGEWCLQVGLTYPHLEVVGGDKDSHMVAYARAQAKSRELPNVSFVEMDALSFLPFEAGTFDYVNLRFSPGWIPRTKYSSFFHECARILRLGGFFTSTEGENPIMGISSPATAKGFKWVSQVLIQLGLAYGDGYTSIIPTHANYLKASGFTEIKRSVVVSDASYGSAYYELARQDILILFQLLQPRIIGLGVSQEEFAETFRSIQQEIEDEDFACLCYILTTIGKKVY